MSTLRRPLTDSAMLRAAERALVEHRATRPATPSEAARIAAAHRAQEASLLASATQMRAAYAHPPTAADIGRGPNAPAMQSAGNLAATGCLQQALACESLATQPQLRAEAWERLDTASAWTAWEASLLARVAYYRALVDGQVEVAS